MSEEWAGKVTKHLAGTWHDDQGVLSWHHRGTKLKSDFLALHVAVGSDVLNMRSVAVTMNNIVANLYDAPQSVHEREWRRELKQRAKDYAAALDQLDKQIAKLEKNGCNRIASKELRSAANLARGLPPCDQLPAVETIFPLNDRGSIERKLLIAAARAITLELDWRGNTELSRSVYNLAVSISGAEYASDWKDDLIKITR